MGEEVDGGLLVRLIGCKAGQLPSKEQRSPGKRSSDRSTLSIGVQNPFAEGGLKTNSS